MTTARTTSTAGWWRLLLAAIAAALVTLLGAGTASAATLTAAETRVGASPAAGQIVVGPHECITAGQRWGDAPPQAETAAGSCVAAKTGTGVVDDVVETAARACSFSGATLVLMADGSKEPIDEVTVGDQVLATDPETGEQVAKRVERVFVHDDQLIDLALADGTVLATTDNHPYWSVTDQRFERADKLATGEKVLAADGRAIAVSGLRLESAHQGLAYNLSVQDIHTYHVGNDAVLVHNACSILGRQIAQHSLDEGHRIPGLDTADSLGQYVDNIMSIPGTPATRGRTVWWDGDRGLITIRQGDAGTVFKPDRGYQYFRDQIDE